MPRFEPSSANRVSTPPSGLCRNIEIKARLNALDAARAAAAAIATDRLQDQHQVDTYFVCSCGRLKLREINGRDAQLISYARDNAADPKASDYRIVPVADPAALKEALRAACGIKAVVEKRREIFLFENVRIHLDQVRGLGEFLELEAVLDGAADDDVGRELIQRLLAHFSVRSSDLLPSSYADMAQSRDDAPHSAAQATGGEL